MGRLSAVAMTALLVSWSTLFSLQLVLLPTPASAVLPAAVLVRGVTFIATPILKKLATDYLVKKGKEGVTDISERSKSKDKGGESEQAQLGSSAAQGFGPVVLNLTVGTPAKQNISGIIDITFQAIWAQCAPCVSGSCLTTATFRPADSTSFSAVLCDNPTLCIVPQPQTSCTATAPGCKYTNFYGSDAATGINYYTTGYLATESFTIGDTSVPMVFGCSTDSTLDFSAFRASGVIGFGRGDHSIVRQLQLSKFSYLLATDDADGSESVIRLGDDAAPKTKRSRSTPLLTNNVYPYLYYVRLTGIQVDGQALSGIPAATFELQADGSGGVFLSTTSPATFLNVAAYSVLRSALVSKIQEQGVSPVDGQDLSHLCYRTQDFDKVKVPKLTLVLDGSAMELTTGNYFFNAAGTNCLSILPSSGVSVLGSLLQTGTNMIYDIDGGRLTFEKAAAETAAGASAPSSQVSFMIVAPLLLVWVLLL